MPLDPATLTHEILRLTDQTLSDFVGWPKVLLPDGSLDVAGTNALVAQNWANAARAFFQTMVVPPVLPPVLDAAAASFATAMAGALGPPGAPTAAAALAAGFGAFAVTVALGAVPPVAVPPPAPLVPPIGPPTALAEPPAALLAVAVFAWAKTGLYGVPPQPPSVPWS